MLEIIIIYYHNAYELLRTIYGFMLHICSKRSYLLLFWNIILIISINHFNFYVNHRVHGHDADLIHTVHVGDVD